MTDSQFDPNKVVVDLFASMVKNYGATIKDYVKSPIAKLIDAYKYDVTEYLNATLERCSKVKTFLNRDEPVSLLDIYVKTKFKSDRRVIFDDDVLFNISDLHHLAIILGSAGSGKTMFMKYLFIKLSQTPNNRVPILIELRRLAGVSSKSLTDFIYQSLITPGAKTTHDQFISGLKHSLFTIILDGFDEVDIDDRINVQKQILELRDRFPSLPIIVSSREDNRFSSWDRFRVYRVQPLGQKQVLELVYKSKYDDQIKREFAREIRKSLYRKHQSFLSNPLLAVMMLITFKEIAHVPDKLHIFYEQAFSALYFKHDASKEAAYRRKTYCELPIDEFKKCLACFCIATYLKGRFMFTDSQVMDDIRKAIEMSKVNTEPERFLADLLESVCILQLDGIQVTFTHRSFQEYFAALFIDKCPNRIDKMLDFICEGQNDLIIKLIFDVNRSRFEREWAVPKLKEFLSTFEHSDFKSLVLAEYGVDSYISLDAIREWNYIIWSASGVGSSLDLTALAKGRVILAVIMGLYPNVVGDVSLDGLRSMLVRDWEQMMAAAEADSRIKNCQFKRDARRCLYVRDIPDEYWKKVAFGSCMAQMTKAMGAIVNVVSADLKAEDELVDALLP